MVVTTKSRILIYLRARQPSYISSTELERMSVDWGTKASTIGRRARELEDEGRIQRKLIGKVVWYRLTQAEPAFDPNKFLESLRKEEVKQGSLL